MMNVEVDGKGFNIEIDVDVKVIAEALRQDIEDNLKFVRSYDGSEITPLKDSYAGYKQKKLGHSRIFDGFRKGNDKLFNSIKKKKQNKYEYIIFVGNNNNDIMTYLQQGKSPLAGPRRAFGVDMEGVKRIGEAIDGAIYISDNGKRT